MTTEEFPLASTTNPEHVRRMREMADELAEDLSGEGYTKAAHKAADKRQLKAVRKWLSLVAKESNPE